MCSMETGDEVQVIAAFAAAPPGYQAGLQDHMDFAQGAA